MTQQFSETEPDTPRLGEVDADDTSTQSLAKDQAAQVGQGAADAGKHVAGLAKDEASNVAAEAASQAKDVLHQARGEITQQAGAQQQRAASGLRSLSDELGSMAARSEQPGIATDLARQASAKAGDIAQWLDQGDPASLLEDVRRFARQRPVAFLAIAAAAGVVAGRLTRGLKDSPDTGTSSSGAHADAGAGAYADLDSLGGSDSYVGSDPPSPSQASAATATYGVPR